MAEDVPKKPSAAGTIIGVVIATLLAVVCGGGGGVYMAQMFDKAENEAADTGKTGKSAKTAKSSGKGKGPDKAGKKKDGAKEDEKAGDDAMPAGPPKRIVLAPITTNLIKPNGAWIRLEASVMPTKDLPENHEELLAQVQEDLLGFLRTLKLAQIQGPSGFQHMREDLNDRVKIRSEGIFNKLLIHALLVE